MSRLRRAPHVTLAVRPTAFALAAPTHGTHYRRTSARALRLNDGGATIEARVTPGILLFALRASLRLFQIAPRDLVKIDILTCEYCVRALKVIASIEDRVVIKKILQHLNRHAEAATPGFRPFDRAPPQQQLAGLTQPD